MAKGKKTGGRDFKPGHPGGPGKPRTPEDVKLARLMNRDEFTRILSEFGYLTVKQLNAITAAPSTNAWQHMVLAAMRKAVKGDTASLGLILDRAIGKVPQQFEHAGAGGGPIRYEDLPTEEVRSRLATILKRHSDDEGGPGDEAA